MVSVPDNQSDPTNSPSPAGGGFGPLGSLPKNSFGLKLLLVCALALIMAIPALFVFGVVFSCCGPTE